MEQGAAAESGAREGDGPPTRPLPTREVCDLAVWEGGSHSTLGCDALEMIQEEHACSQSAVEARYDRYCESLPVERIGAGQDEMKESDRRESWMAENYNYTQRETEASRQKDRMERAHASVPLIEGEAQASFQKDRMERAPCAAVEPWGVHNGVFVYYNYFKDEAAEAFEHERHYLGRIASSGNERERGSRAGIPIALVSGPKPAAATGDAGAQLFGELEEKFPGICMYQSACCFVEMSDPEATIAKLNAMGDVSAAIQDLAAHAATVPILHALIQLSLLVAENIKMCNEQARKKCQQDNRKWHTTKESLLRKHTSVEQILRDLLRDGGQLLRARGPVSRFLGMEGSQGADGRLFDPNLTFFRFLHDCPESLLVTVTPSIVKKHPGLTEVQWLAIFRLHLRADLLSHIMESSADTFEATGTVGSPVDGGGERIYLSRQPGRDHPITKHDAMWIIERPRSSSAFGGRDGSRQADSSDLSARPTLDGNLHFVLSVSQDNFSLQSMPATGSGLRSEMRMKGLGSVRKHFWEYEAAAKVGVGAEASQPFSALAGYPVTGTLPFAPHGFDLAEACKNAKLTDTQAVVFKKAASTQSPVINLTSPAGAGKSRVALAWLKLWVDRNSDSRKIACYAVSKPLLREPMLKKAEEIFGPTLARHVVIAGIRDESFEYLADAIKQATKEATLDRQAEIDKLDSDIEAEMAAAPYRDRTKLLDRHARRSQLFWRWVSETEVASAEYRKNIKIVILTTGKLLKEIASDGGILSKRDLEVVVLDEAQQERAFTVLAIAANTKAKMLLAQDPRQRFVSPRTHDDAVASTDGKTGGAGRKRGEQATDLLLNPFLTRDTVVQVDLTAVIRQGPQVIEFLKACNPAKYRDLVSHAHHETNVCVIPFSTPSEWVSVEDDLPEPMNSRESNQHRVYRNKTFFLAIGALVERSIRKEKSVMVIVYTDRMRRAILGHLREFLKARGCLEVAVEVAGTPSAKMVIVTSPVGSGGVDVDVVVGMLGTRRYKREFEFNGHVLNEELRYIMVTRGICDIFLFLEVFQASERPKDATYRAASRELPLDRALMKYSGWTQYPCTADLAAYHLLDNTEQGWDYFKKKVELEAEDCWCDGSRTYDACDWAAIATSIKPMAKETMFRYLSNPQAHASFMNSEESALPIRRPKRQLEKDFSTWTANSDVEIRADHEYLMEWCSLVVPNIRVSIASENTVFFSVQVVARLLCMRRGEVPLLLADPKHPMHAVEPENFQYQALGALAEKQQFPCGRNVRHHKLFTQDLNELGAQFFYKMCRSERAKISVRMEKDSNNYLIESHHGMGLEGMHPDICSFVFIAKNFDVFSDFVLVLCENGADLKNDAVEFDLNGEHEEHARKLRASLGERGITSRGI